MPVLTHILKNDPNSLYMLEVFVIISSCGVFGLGAHLQRCYFRKSPYIYIQIMALFIIAVIGIATFGLEVKFSNYELILLSVLSAPFMAYFSLVLNNKIVNHKATNSLKETKSRFDNHKTAINKLSAPRANAKTLPFINQSTQPSILLYSLLLTALFEELIFRGVLIQFASMQSTKMFLCIVLLSLTAFSTAHIFFGNVHIIAKLPLSLFCLISCLLFHNLIGSVLIHMIFNYQIWKEASPGSLNYFLLVYKK